MWISHYIVLSNLCNVRHFPRLICTLGDIALMAHVLSVLWVPIFLLLPVVVGSTLKFLLKITFCDILGSFILDLAVVDHVFMYTRFLAERVREYWSSWKQSDVSRGATSSMMTFRSPKKLLLIGIDICTPCFERVFARYKIWKVCLEHVAFLYRVHTIPFTFASLSSRRITSRFLSMRYTIWLIRHDTLLSRCFCPNLPLVLLSRHIQREMFWTPRFFLSMADIWLAWNYPLLEVSACLLPHTSRTLSRSHIRRGLGDRVIVALTYPLLFQNLLLLLLT